MGRWSRLLGRAFLDWLRAAPDSHWLEIGCGTGALTSSILELARPASLTACDPSAPFVDHARDALADERVSFTVAAADDLPSRDGGFDFVVSGLVLNFVPRVEEALESMRERASEGGTVAAYVWDYQGGLEFLQHFWAAAVALDPAARTLDEARRFERWSAAAIARLFHDAGLVDVESSRLEVTTEFANFADYWEPLLGGTGPAPSYVASLDRPHRDRLEVELTSRLPSFEGGRIRLRAGASAVRGKAP
jgi:ubiquinone/menaquinone biosynthesis C-methylase UbiE